MPKLPIESVLPALKDALIRQPNVVLIAPPGAGKTTQVPLALLESSWLAGRRIIMLEPRRLAARGAAVWMAGLLGEEVGNTIGYRMRMDNRTGPDTRVEVVTEGILTRLLQTDPALEQYGLVIFDEFHERSLQADLGLALCLDVQQNLRDDLRLLVMSATLEGEAVARLLGGAPLIRSEGRGYPVEPRYTPKDLKADLAWAVCDSVLHALRENSGGILVFLPGEAEIKRVQERLLANLTDAAVSVHPLFGNLTQQQQQAAIAPAGEGKRKIVLATSIAETSLTIEDVRVVIDAGLTRAPRFSPRSGMTRLETLRVSQASAEQRRGRAGRVAPGICYRLWSEQSHKGLVPSSAPEILQADLAPLALELAQWAIHDPNRLAWLDPPPASSYAQALELLSELDALDERGRVTAHGRRMRELALHPRLAHMILLADKLKLGALACDIAALLSERDILRPPPDARACDLRLRLDALHNKNTRGQWHVDRRAMQMVERSAAKLRGILKIKQGTHDSADTGLLLAFAYPDRIAQARPGGAGRYLLSNGKGAMLNELDPLATQNLLAVAELGGSEREARVYLAAPLELSDILRHFGEHIREQRLIDWDQEKQLVVARRQKRLGSLILHDAPTNAEGGELIQALLSGIRRQGLDALPWDEDSRAWCQRVDFLRKLKPDAGWPDVSNQVLSASLEDWLAPYLNGMTRLNQLKNLKLKDILSGMLDWPRQQELDRFAPTHIQVPSGSRIRIDYANDPPVLAVRLQEMFGLSDTPCIANGNVPLLLHLLSPARRPIQVTRDLAGFWRTTYAEVKKDLKGRYPKHFWPDDPLQAEATSRAKPRKR